MASPKNPNSNGTQPQSQTPTPPPDGQQPPAPPPAPARSFQKIVYRDRPAAPVAETVRDEGEYDPVVDDIEGDDEETPEVPGAVKPHPQANGKPAAAEPEEPPAPAHSPRILRLAQDFGFSDRDIAVMSPDQLEEEVTEVSRQLARDRRAATANEASRPQPAKPQAEPEPEVDPYELDLADDEYDQKLIGSFGKLRDFIKAQAEEIKELKNRVGQISQIEGRRHAETQAQMVDRVFDSLDSKDVFGVGRPPQNTREYAKRVAVLQYVDGAMKDRRGTVEEKLREAAETLFGIGPSPTRAKPDRPAKPAAPAREDPTGKWRAGATIAPTRRAPEKSAKGLAAARRTFQNGMRDLGIEADSTGTDENDELPD